MQDDQYQIYYEKIIGTGSFGTVYVCKDKQNPQLNLCAKIIEKKQQNDKTEREMELMELIMRQGKNNKNIVGVYHVDIKQERITLILERCECDLQMQFKEKQNNENKYSLIKLLFIIISRKFTQFQSQIRLYYTPNEVLNILKQIINGYKLLYDNNIIHRDIKPQNILILKGVYKIADFGLARVYQTHEELTKAGTPKYASPQQIQEGERFTNSADIFSLGIVCYELIFGCMPYKITSYQQLLYNLKKLESTPVKIDRQVTGMTEEIASLIENMLKYSCKSLKKQILFYSHLYHESQRISWNSLFSHPLLNDQPITPKQIIRPQGNPQMFFSVTTQKCEPKLQQPPLNVGIQQTLDISDQIYQIAIFMNNILDSLDKHLNQQKQIHADMIKIKQQLYYCQGKYQFEYFKFLENN